MSSRDYIESHPETVQDLELASADRLWEGLELLMAGRTGGGVYLLGYVVEMVLKNACFMLDGAHPADPVYPRLRPIRNFGNHHFPAIDSENYHSLVFWYHALLCKRNLAGRPLSAQMSRQLGRRITRVYSTWTVAMRYYPDGVVPPTDSNAIYNDVIWIYDRRLQLRV